MSNPFFRGSEGHTRAAEKVLDNSRGRGAEAALKFLGPGLRLAVDGGAAGVLILAHGLCHMTYVARTHPEGEEFLEGLERAITDLQKLGPGKPVGPSNEQVSKDGEVRDKEPA